MPSGVDRFDDPDWVREYECLVGTEVIIPFLRQQLGIKLNGKHILDLGCGSGGILLACARACDVTGVGVDFSGSRIAAAKAGAAGTESVRFAIGDIMDPQSLPQESFDLVFLIDVVEHLPDLAGVQRALAAVHQLVAQTGGRALVTFPPYRSPFGGHQAGWAGLTYLPWVHLLPTYLLRRIARASYRDFVSRDLNHITISDFENCVEGCGIGIEERFLYLLRPEYSVRYGVRAVPQIRFLRRIPWLLELFTTGAYYWLGTR